MNPPSVQEIASSLASSFVVGHEGGFPNAKKFVSPMSDDDVAADEDTTTLPRRFADHTYHNYSTYIEDGGKLQKHKKSESNFPARLHAMLSNEDYSHIISWMPHGRAWKVHDKKLFVEEAIPKYFGQSKYSSFTRQLSGWGFKRLHQMGPDFGCYYHECFLRGHARLTILMRRISPGQGKATPNAYEEPDFYTIAKRFPLHATDEEPLFSPDKFEFEGKESGKVEATEEEAKPSSPQEVMNFDPIPVSNHNNLDSLDMAWTKVAPICMEDGVCTDTSCHGSNDDQQYSEDSVIDDQDAPGIPYLQSLLHNLLMYQDASDAEDVLYQMAKSIPEHDFGLNTTSSQHEDNSFQNSPQAQV